MRTWTPAAVFAFLIIRSTAAYADQTTIVDTQFRVDAGKSVCTTVTVTAYEQGRIYGNVSASGGVHNDIRVLILKDQKIVIFDSGPRQSVPLRVAVTEAGTYAVCFDNRFSLVSAKNVRADLKLARRATRDEELAQGFAAGLGTLGALGALLSGKPVDQALSHGLSTADNIFSDLNWSRLRGNHRVLQSWRVMNPSGDDERADIEVVLVGDARETDKWCRSVLEAVFKQVPHPAWGCTKPGPPWRIVSVDPRLRSQTIAHEVWHTKGYWGHVQLKNGETWPADPRTGRVAPFRVPQADD